MRIANNKTVLTESSIDIVTDSVGIVIGDRDETKKNTLKMYIPRFMAGIDLEADNGDAKETSVNFTSSKIVNSQNKDIGASTVMTQNYIEMPCYLIPGLSMPRFVKGQLLRVTFADGDIRSPTVLPYTVQDQEKKMTDILWMGIPAKPNDVDEITPDNSYFLEINTRDQYVRLYTSNVNGENNPFNFLINTKDGYIEVKDDSARLFEWLYNEDKFHWHTDAGLDVSLKENTATILCEKYDLTASDSITMKTSKFSLTADKGEFNVEDTAIKGTKLEAKETNVLIDSASAIVLKTIGTDNWHPNVFPTCIVRIPHGGVSGGIIGLKGS